MSILLWITTEMEYKMKCYNRSLLLPRVVIKLTIKGLRDVMCPSYVCDLPQGYSSELPGSHRCLCFGT